MLFIKNATTQVAVSPKRGAIVSSLNVGGKETLYLDQATFENPGQNVRGGIPVLFPICGPLAAADYAWEGSSYSMKQHGFARNLEWVVEEHTDARLALRLTDNQATRVQYPFAFSYLLEYSALANGLRIEQTIENRGERPMPAQFGFHPYFLVGDKERLQFDLPVTTYDDNKSDAHGTFPGFDFSKGEIDWAFPKPTARQAGFTDPSRGHHIQVTYGDAYELLVFWTLQGSPFVCVEPWSSSRLAFPTGQDVHRIGAGESLSTSVDITVLTS